jgi:plastocyanin
MRRLVAILLALAVTSAAIAGGTALAARTKTVKMSKRGGNSFYSPKRLRVKKGTVVKWRTTSAAPHDVKVRRGPVKFHSRIVFRGSSYKRRMRRTGTYRIYCTIHGRRDMSMVLRVVR